MTSPLLAVAERGAQTGAAAAYGPPSRPTLRRLLEELGSTFLSPLSAIPDTSRRVSGALVYDPFDEQAVTDGSVILGVGLSDGPEFRSVLARLGAQGASAFVLREPFLASEETAALAQRYSVALLGLLRGASWTQLSALVGTLLNAPDESRARAVAGLPGGDLFAVTNAIGALIDAPVTIEDRNSRVLAFSSRQGEADASRIETILERQVPEKYSRLLAEAGFFKKLYSSESPVTIQLVTEDGPIKPRTAIAVRAGDEILGSIWAATDQPLDEERSAALRDAARVVALHLLSARAGADVTRRLRADLLSTALEGGEGAAYALERLGLHEQHVAVFAAGLIGGDEHDLAQAGERERRRHHIAAAFAVHLAAVHPKACVAPLGDTIYGILPVTAGPDGDAQAARLGSDFLSRLGPGTDLSIGIGRVTSGRLGMVASRDDAERALRVLGERESRAHVALFSDVHVDSLLLELRDRFSAAAEQASGPIARLHEHDVEHGTDFVETLRVWLDCMGDVTRAAAALHIHPNTFRYRLRRLAEVGDMDLGDADARFAAQLQLRIVPQLARARRAG